jgi:radical SAM superfamily enzyme YgiQ (UPF0313 family)
LQVLGYRGHVDFVDDNLIGNKKVVKRSFWSSQKWLEARDYPFEFTTEASINLADGPELLKLMECANFVGVFVGIESPDTATLIAMRKKRNTRRSIAQSVHTIYASGLFVTAGFIIGFDSETESAAEAMIELIEDLSMYSQTHLNKVARKLNERPRKTLEFETPAERFNACVASTG